MHAKEHFTHLQGAQRRLLSRAVKCIDADQSRLGAVSKSKADASSLITPFPEAARETSWDLLSFVAAKTKGSARNGRKPRSFIVNVEEFEIVDAK